MKRTVPVLALAALAACATSGDMLQLRQPQAVDAALAVARRDLSCPEATGKVVSSHVIEAMTPHTPRYGYGTPDRYEYTVAAEGCGKSGTFSAVCTEGQGCAAAPARP